jgi:hypothetical protein
MSNTFAPEQHALQHWMGDVFMASTFAITGRALQHWMREVMHRDLPMDALMTTTMAMDPADERRPALRNFQAS